MNEPKRKFKCKLPDGRSVIITAPSPGSLRRIAMQKYDCLINVREVEEIIDACSEELSKISNSM